MAREITYEEFEDCEVKAATKKALLLEIPENGEKWVPRSVLSDDTELDEQGDAGTAWIARWFAEKEGLT